MIMSEESDKPLAMEKLPRFLIKKNNLKVVNKTDLVKACVYREDTLYESMKGDFLKLNTPCTIVNKLNLITKNSITVARFGGETPFEKTSESITRIIGQNNYDTLLSALCSVFSHELKIRAIISLLTTPKKTKTVSCQTEDKPIDSSKFIDKDCQTDESSDIMFSKEKQPSKRIKRRQATPYVVTESPKKRDTKKVIIHPGPFYKLNSTSSQLDKSKSSAYTVTGVLENSDQLLMSEENSNDSTGKMSTFTVDSIPGLMCNPLGLLENVDKVTETVSNHPPTLDWQNNTVLTMLDGTTIRIPFKIEDEFHIATPEVMKVVPAELHRKLLWYQVYIDWKNCLAPDEENHLPLHTAAINGDASLLRRQCAILKSRQESVDITTDENMTAIQISIFRNHPQCTALLLYFGADPMVTDDEYRTCFHLAAETDSGHLMALVKYCQSNPMKILKENEELWKPELATKRKNYLAKYLMKKVSAMFDNQGYTPLMLASKLGKHENVKILAEACPDTVNAQMPNSGNTALYLAVGSACWNASNRGNKSTVSDDFRKTIELLVEFGADPAIENHSGSNVNTVLTDLHVGELSMIIANKMTSRNCFDFQPNASNVCVILKDEDGNLGYQKLSKGKLKKDNDKVVKDIKDKPVILQNIKIEKDDPIIKQIQINTSSIDVVLKKEKLSPIPKKRPYKKTNESPKKSAKVNVKDDYMDSFKNFLYNVNNAEFASLVPVTDPDKVENILKKEQDNKEVNSEPLKMNSSSLKNNICSFKTKNPNNIANILKKNHSSTKVISDTLTPYIGSLKMKIDPTNVASTSKTIVVSKMVKTGNTMIVNKEDTIKNNDLSQVNRTVDKIAVISRKRPLKIMQNKLNLDTKEANDEQNESIPKRNPAKYQL